MKKNLLAMLLAVIMVAAVIFIAAPATKAETVEADITLSADTTETLVIDTDKTLNLNGFDATVTINEGVTLTIVDTKFMEGEWDLTGASAGTLTVAEGSQGAINTWAQFNDYKYLAVKNGDTYSAHPFNIMVSELGVNTHSTTVTVGITVIADDVVAALIDAGQFGLRNYSLQGTEKADKEYTPHWKKFVDGDNKTNGLKGYIDLTGSLDSTVLTNDLFANVGAYIKLNAGYGEIIINSNTKIDIYPKTILNTLANKYSTLSPDDKARMQKLMISSTSVKEYLNNASVPVEDITKGYVKITSASQLTSGKYVLVAEDGYAPTVLNNGWVEVGQPIIDKFGTITEANAASFLWTLTVDGDSVVLTDTNSKDIAPEGGNENGIKEGEYNWAISFENGVFSFSGTGEDTVTLACNKNSGYKIKAYKNSTANTYPHTFTLYKETEIVACKHTNASAATCTDASVCQDCGVIISVALGHADENYDHKCDNGCNEFQGECGDFDNNGLCDYGSNHENGCKKEFEITETPSVPDPETYTFSTYPAGTQYAEETHTLSNYVSMAIKNCHLNTQLRIYSSSSNNGYAIFSSKYPISSISFNMGYKVDTLNIYVSDNGTDWTLDGSVATTATSYKDYTYELETKSSYIKLDVAGTNQIRIAAMTITFYQAIAHDCDYSEVYVTAPTCTTPGYTTHTCSVCGDSYTDSETPATGHTAGAAATCTDDQICTVCKEVLAEATGHDYVDGTCKNCGEPEAATGTPITESMSIFGTTGTKSSDSSSISWTSGNITFTNQKGSTAIRTSDSDHYRVYQNSTVTISADGKITQIIITCTSSSYATVVQTSLTNAGYTAEVSGSTVTVTATGDVSSITFTASEQTRLSQIEVTYTK